jgi:leader peptidase (prepilin peptidase) / N-methyltransferase
METMFDPVLPAAAFIFGLMTGSFLNVCIHRLPLSKSIVHPGSMCPQCGHKIRFYDNIPVLSYMWLKGKCRNCKTPISPRYPMVEVLTGLMAAGVFLKYGLTTEALIYFIFVCVLLVITFIDIDHRIILDIITLPGIPVFFAASFFLPEISVVDSITGILLGGGSLLAVAWGYFLLMRKEGMGGGDVKLLAMMGAVMGWKGVLFTLFVSSLVGSVVGIIVMAVTKKNMKLSIPFGPFLSIGAMMYVFFGFQFISWYFNLLH